LVGRRHPKKLNRSDAILRIAQRRTLGNKR
jgi:hypothetical protein